MKSKYNPNVFLGYEKWEAEAALQLEDEFMKVREASDELSKSRKALLLAESKILLVNEIYLDKLEKNIK